MTEDTTPAPGTRNSDRERFDADARSIERAKRGIIIGGVEYHPRRRTGRVIKEILEIDTDKHDDESVSAYNIRQIDVLYQQVQILLRDANGAAPDTEQMQDESAGLELEDARELLGWLGATEDRSEDSSPTTAQG